MRQLRDSSSDRDAVRKALAALHVAHAEAEEKHVYPKLSARTRSPSTRPSTARRSTPRDTRRCSRCSSSRAPTPRRSTTPSRSWPTALNHHLTEEELTILNPAREEVGEQVRAELGVAFATERNQQLDDDCGAIDNVRRIVEAAEKEGLLDEDDEESEDSSGGPSPQRRCRIIVSPTMRETTIAT